MWIKVLANEPRLYLVTKKNESNSKRIQLENINIVRWKRKYWVYLQREGKWWKIKSNDWAKK